MCLQEISSENIKKSGKFIFQSITFQLLFLIGLSIMIYQKLLKEGLSDDKFRSDIYQMTILFLLVASSYYYAWHAIFKANVLELFAYLIINTCTTAATTMNFSQKIKASLEDEEYVLAGFEIAYVITSLLLTIVSLTLSKSFYDVFSYEIYLKVGASQEYQTKYRDFAYFLSLMKLYAQLCIIVFFTIFYLYDFYDTKQSIYIILADGLALILVVVSFFMGYKGVKQRAIKLVAGYFTLIIMVTIYFSVRMILIIVLANVNENSIQGDKNTSSIIVVTIFVSIIVLISNIYFGIKCMKNNLVNADYGSLNYQSV